MIKKLMQLRNTIVALLGIEFVLVLLTYMFLQNRVTLALMIYILIKNVVCIIVLYYLHNMFSETTYSVKEALNNESKNALIFGGIGLIKYDENRNVVWVSDLLHELGIRIVGKKLLEWQPLLAILFEDEDVRTIDINSRKYEVYNSRNNRLLFLKDVTDLTTIEKEYNDQQLCVAYLTIDNYDDSIEYADEQKSVMIETTSRQMIFDWAKDNGIILKRYKEDGYLAVFNERIYRKQVEVRFCILDEFKQKMESIGAVMSLSMGIGRGSKVLRELDELAFSAISLSYSRGGDQVAVKTLDEEIRYFGGNSENSEKANRVRARVISQTLASLVKQSPNILIMGHKQSDLDSFGASLAVAKFAKAFEKDAYVIVDENSSVILNDFPERIINRFLDQHIVSRFCICLHCHCKCKDNSRCLEQPFRFDLPAVTTFHPGSYCIKICFICLCIAIYTMLCLTQQCILNIGTCLKIHICNP